MQLHVQSRAGIGAGCWQGQRRALPAALAECWTDGAGRRQVAAEELEGVAAAHHRLEQARHRRRRERLHPGGAAGAQEAARARRQQADRRPAGGLQRAVVVAVVVQVDKAGIAHAQEAVQLDTPGGGERASGAPPDSCPWQTLLYWPMRTVWPASMRTSLKAPGTAPLFQLPATFQ